MDYKDYYSTLGVARTASEDEIKRAYRKLARKYHPDVSKEADAEARFKEVAEAYEVLKDADKRAEYDQIGRAWNGGAPPPDWDAGFEFTRRAGGGAAPEHSDFFDALFGRHHRAPPRPAPLRGEDHHAKVLIDLEDAYHGTRRRLTLRVPVYDDEGHGGWRERELEVVIPKGVRPGRQLRLSGQGAPGWNGGPPGDLYLELAFRPHRWFRVLDPDIEFDLPVAPWEAALGGVVIVPTPEGPVELRVPPGSAAGRRLRLKGRGLPGPTAGDLYAVFTIAQPAADSEALRQAYRGLAAAAADFDPRAAFEE